MISSSFEKYVFDSKRKHAATVDLVPSECLIIARNRMQLHAVASDNDFIDVLRCSRRGNSPLKQGPGGNFHPYELVLGGKLGEFFVTPTVPG